MSVRNSVLLVSVYGVMGLIVILAGYVLYTFYSQGSNLPVALGPTATPSLTGPPTDPRDVERLYAHNLLDRSNQRLKQIQQLLEMTSSKLHERTETLAEKNAENRQLQAELDQTIALVFELATEGLQNDEAILPEDNQNEVDRILEQFQTELKTLRDELGKSEFLEQEHAAQLETLQGELMSAEADIAALQLEAEEEIAALLDEKSALESASRRALVTTGAAAVPALVNLLENDRADVRAWAAYVLGEIGGDSSETRTALTALLMDPDEMVRNQAQNTLARLDAR